MNKKKLNSLAIIDIDLDIITNKLDYKNMSLDSLGTNKQSRKNYNNNNCIIYFNFMQKALTNMLTQCTKSINTYLYLFTSLYTKRQQIEKESKFIIIKIIIL